MCFVIKRNDTESSAVYSIKNRTSIFAPIHMIVQTSCIAVVHAGHVYSSRASYTWRNRVSISSRRQLIHLHTGTLMRESATEVLHYMHAGWVGK